MLLGHVYDVYDVYDDDGDDDDEMELQTKVDVLVNISQCIHNIAVLLVVACSACRLLELRCG